MMNTKTYNKALSFVVIAAIAVLSVVNCSMASAKDPKVLVFAKAAGFQHGCIPSGIATVFKLGKENKFDVDISVDPADFNDANLKQYAALIFMSTTGEFLKDESQKAALQKYIKNGGGFVGVHAASDAMNKWQWYGDLVGAYFKQHPQGTPLATLNVVDRTSNATKFLPERWERKDEWYAFTYLPKDVHVLIKLDESSLPAGTYDGRGAGAKMGEDHPMAWWHNFDGGRSFYTALGHTDDSYQDPLFIKHLMAGIDYAMGRKKL